MQKFYVTPSMTNGTSVSDLLKYINHQMTNPFIQETERNNIQIAASVIMSGVSFLEKIKVNIVKETALRELTHRETEVLYLACTGITYSRITDILNLTVSTIKFHMAKIVKKLGVKNAKQAILCGIRLQLTDYSPHRNAA